RMSRAAPRETRIASTGVMDSLAAIASPFHDADFVDLEAALVAHINNDNRQGHRHLGGRHRDDEDRKELATQMRKKEREGHQVDIDCAEHQLQAHQDDQDIASAQYAIEADDK